MISLSLQSVADNLNATLFGDDLIFSGCSTDTRSIKKGQLFVALQGPSFDGHEYIKVAEQSGAAAVMVEKNVSTDLPVVQVEDTRIALGDIAGMWRDEFDLPLVAITGSNGKTSVKEMLHAILTNCGNVLSTKGNLNNDIGVPQTLFNLKRKNDFAVIEMGANHQGEIARLCQIAKPQMTAVTLCSPAHLEGFGSVEGVAQAKGEIFSALKSDGIAVINNDDQFAPLWKKLAGDCRVITFGLNENKEVNDISAKNIIMQAQSSEFELSVFDQKIEIKLPLPGRHNIMNALTAAACATGLNISLEKIRSGLQSLAGVAGRLQFKKGLQSLQIIDDTYNANPQSLSAALAVLNDLKSQAWLALGDMGELGATAIKMHIEAGQEARDAGVERLFTIGSLSKNASQAFGAGAEHFADHQALVEAIKTIKNKSDKEITLLVKGSRSAQMEKVVQALEVETCC